jgi:hypothetical protein
MEEKQRWKCKTVLILILAWIIIDVAVDSVATHFFNAPLMLRVVFNVGIFFAVLVTYLITKST